MKRIVEYAEICPYCEEEFVIGDSDSHRSWNRHRGRCERAATHAALFETAVRDRNIEKFLIEFENPNRTLPLYVCGSCFFSQIYTEHVPARCPRCTHGHMNDADEFAAILCGAYKEPILQ